MANTINPDAGSHVQAVARIHGAVTDFIAFVQGIQAGIGSDYSQVLNVPSRVTNLVAQKAAFDALNISGATTKAILEKNHGYGDWTATHTADFNAVFTAAIALRTAVEANADAFPPSFTAQHQIRYVTASASVQVALDGLINDILASVT